MGRSHGFKDISDSFQKNKRSFSIEETGTKSFSWNDEVGSHFAGKFNDAMSKAHRELENVFQKLCEIDDSIPDDFSGLDYRSKSGNLRSTIEANRAQGT